MSSSLEIKLLEGSPALADHRVSLADFGPALKVLLKVVQRAAQLAHKDSGNGRLPFSATLIDVEVAGITPNCATLNLAVVQRAQHDESSMLSSILDAAVRRAANDIQDAASTGQSQNGAALKFVRFLPDNTRAACVAVSSSGTRNVYEFARSGALTMNVQKRPPALRTGKAKVIAICVREGSESVTIQSDALGEMKASASKALAKEAARLAFLPVVEFAMVGAERQWRLVRLRAVECDVPPPDVQPDAIWDHLVSRWNRTLELLAQ